MDQIDNTELSLCSWGQTNNQLIKTKRCPSSYNQLKLMSLNMASVKESKAIANFGENKMSLNKRSEKYKDSQQILDTTNYGYKSSRIHQCKSNNQLKQFVQPKMTLQQYAFPRKPRNEPMNSLEILVRNEIPKNTIIIRTVRKQTPQKVIFVGVQSKKLVKEESFMVTLNRSKNSRPQSSFHRTINSSNFFEQMFLKRNIAIQKYDLLN